MEKDQEDAPEHNHVNAVSRLAQERDEMRTLNSHRKNRNITDEFIQTTTQLLPGQLVKDEYFTLFEAVGALEIMDPKMDSGFIPEGDTFDADFDPSAPLQAGEVIWIMDQLLCLEITWLDGYPLSQTIFTSLHVDRLIAPDNKHFTFANDGPEVGLDKENLGDILTHQILRAYCVALLKCVELVSLNIQSQTFFEEEDFVTHLFGRELLPQVSAEQASDLMMNVKGWVEQQDGEYQASW